MIGNIYAKLNRYVLFDTSKKKKHRDMDDQSRYLEKLPTPKDQYEKAYFKYKCFAYYHFSHIIVFIYNALAIIAMIPLMLYVRKRKVTIQKNAELSGATLIVMPSMDYSDIFPNEIKEKYGEIKYANAISLKDRSLDKMGWCCFWNCYKRYWMHPYFTFEVLLRLAGACEIIKRYHSKAIVSYIAERDFTEPILLEYCNSFGIDRLSFMHGTFVYSIDKAYISFNKYYVWEDYYLKMFNKLCADDNSLCLYTPLKYRPIVTPHSEDCPYSYFITYYCAPEPEDRLKRIKTCLDVLKSHGYKCKLRPHPRFSDVGLLSKIFFEYEIEDLKKVNLSQSMEDSEFIAAFNSTVLTEAFYSHKKIIIDDLVNPEKYINMIDRDYIMLHRPHYTMSQVISEFCKVDMKKILI